MTDGRDFGSGWRERRRDAPPTVDVVGHLGDLRRAALPAIGVGLLVFLAVFGLRTALVDKQYSATAIGKITTTEIIVGGDAYLEQMRGPFLGLSQDPAVLDSVLAQFDVDWTRADLRAHTTLEAGNSPDVLAVEVRADTPELAVDLAAATVRALDQAAAGKRAQEMDAQISEVQATLDSAQARLDALPEDNPRRTTAQAEIAAMVEQLADIQVSGGSRIQLLAQPSPSDSPVAPKPVAEGAVAGIVAALLAAEAIAFARGRFGTRPSREWARRISRRLHLSYDPDADPTTGLSVRSALMLARRTGPVLVLVDSAARTDLSGFDAAAPGRAIHTAALDDPWWSDPAAGEVESAIVVVAADSASRAQATAQLTRLAELDADVALVLQSAARTETDAKTADR